MADPKTVLFLCTGNYYRSRFAEVLFNHLTSRDGLAWRAASRGLKLGWPENVGAMSRFTEEKLTEMGVPFHDFRHMPLWCRACDLEAASLVIALKEAEHRPMLAERFAGWEDRVTYWHVHDVDKAHPKDALGKIETLVRGLVDQLRTSRMPAQPAGELR